MDEATAKAMSLSEDKWIARTKHICKPCWELKYCPYGPLVEKFPIQDPFGDHSCRAFSHDCPVFDCNEPITEGERLRNISRNIPFKTRMKVILRDDYRCQEWGKEQLR